MSIPNLFGIILDQASAAEQCGQVFGQEPDWAIEEFGSEV